MEGYTWSFDEYKDGVCMTVYGTAVYDTWAEAKAACDEERSRSEAQGCRTLSPSVVRDRT